MNRPHYLAVVLLLVSPWLASAEEIPRLPNTEVLTWKEDLDVKMMDGLHRFIEKKIDQSLEKRASHWKHDGSSPAAYEASIRPNRERFQKILGIVDPRVSVRMERFGTDDEPALVAETRSYTISQVRLAGTGRCLGRGLAAGAKGRAGRFGDRAAGRGPDAGATGGPGGGCRARRAIRRVGW